MSDRMMATAVLWLKRKIAERAERAAIPLAGKVMQERVRGEAVVEAEDKVEAVEVG